MGFSSFNQQRNHGIMGEEGLDDSIPSSSEVSSVVSLESDTVEEDEDDDVTSSASFLPENPSPAAASSPSSQLPAGPLSDMSSLIQQLPIKRGLSMHFQGKSQSFTCLSNVTCLEDLAKPEKPYNKRLKSCKSHAVLSETHKSSNPTRSKSSRFISKMAPRDHSCSSLTAKRPPVNSPQRSTSTSSFSNQTPLFA